MKETRHSGWIVALALQFRRAQNLVIVRVADVPAAAFRIAIILLILLAFAWRLPLLQTREFDQDEFQHLHNAYSIYHGLLPYRDFFEHHTPWLHFILRWIYPIWGEGITAIFVARRLMLLFAGGILYLTYRLGKVLHNTDVGLIGALFLSYTVMFLEKTLEVRPDSGAVAFWLLALLCFVKGVREQRLHWYFLAGLAMGSSIMFTQKSVLALAGLALASLWSYLDRRLGLSFRQNLHRTAMFTTGMSLPIGITSLYFFWHGGLYDFINFNFLMNFRWNQEIVPHTYMFQYVQQNWLISLLACSGLLYATLRLRGREIVRRAEFVPVISTYALIAGLYVIPVPYRQYYLLFLPLLSLFAAVLILQLGQTINRTALQPRWPDLHRRSWLLLSTLYLFVTAWGVFWALDHAHLTSAALLLGIACVWIFALLSPQLMRYAVLVLIGVTLVQPFREMRNAGSPSNKGQLDRIRYILEHSNANDTVLDGFSGYGVFRPHAYFYFFLYKDGVLTMLNNRQRGQDIIDALERAQTKFVIYDEDVQSLNPEVQTYIREHYHPAGIRGIYERTRPERMGNK